MLFLCRFQMRFGEFLLLFYSRKGTIPGLLHSKDFAKHLLESQNWLGVGAEQALQGFSVRWCPKTQNEHIKGGDVALSLTPVNTHSLTAPAPLCSGSSFLFPFTAFRITLPTCSETNSTSSQEAFVISHPAVLSLDYGLGVTFLSHKRTLAWSFTSDTDGVGEPSSPSCSAPCYLEFYLQGLLVKG